MDKVALARLLDQWAAGTVGAAAVKAAAEAALAEPAGDPALAEAIAALDLLDVHLLTAADVPALRALLDGGDLAAWQRYLAAIDLSARSRQLRKDPFYKPFCR